MIVRMTRDRLFRRSGGALAAALVVVLAGCGGTDAVTPAAPGNSDVPASPAAPASRQAPTEQADPPRQLDTSGPSFGVDRVSWPATAKGASKLLNALPQTLRGETLQAHYQPADKEEGDGATASARYGEAISISVFDEYVTSDTESGEPELFTADQLLGARFGLVFLCAKNSYRGTIKPREGGGGPGFDSPKGKSTAKTRWFSCKIDGAEGDDNFKGHAVGWTSKKAGWLVIAEDEKAARSLIAGLVAPTK